jgi:hypothetical protein
MAEVFCILSGCDYVQQIIVLRGDEKGRWHAYCLRLRGQKMLDLEFFVGSFDALSRLMKSRFI